MKKSPTLPAIKDKAELIISHNSKGKDNFRRLQNKVHDHDEEIIKNEKMISNLANEFRLLKQQLQFEQQYSQKYKNTLGKYQQQSEKHLKIIKEQKASIFRLQSLVNEKQRLYDYINSQNIKLKENIQHVSEEKQELKKKIKKKDVQIEKLKKQINDKSKQENQRKYRVHQEIEKKIKSQEEKIVNLQKQITFISACLENNKQQLVLKNKQVEHLQYNIYKKQQLQQGTLKSQLQFKALHEQNQLLSFQNAELKQSIKKIQQKMRNIEKQLQNSQNKNSNIMKEHLKQLNKEKKQHKVNLFEIQKELEKMKKKNEENQKQKSILLNKLQLVEKKLIDWQQHNTKMKNNTGQIQKRLKEIKDNLQCEYCKKLLKQPVTNIPCGHSYCRQCKKGYEKSCSKCPNLKRQAVYRNQLLDDTIAVSNTIEFIITSLIM